MANPSRPVCALAGFAGLALAASAFAAGIPEFRALNPHGGQRGTEVKVEVRGDRLKELQEVLFHEPGITVTGIEPGKSRRSGEPRDDRATVTLKIAPDAHLGEHHFLLRTRGGVTWFQNFHVGPFPAIEEPDADFTREKPLKLTQSNVTVEGALTNEDEDYITIDLKKGQRLSVEVEGFRLATGFFDPHLEIIDGEGFSVASCDDTALLRQDPFLTFTAPADGAYLIAIRDAEYGGGSYRMHIGDFPRPTAVYPAGGQIGQSVAVKFLGDPQGPIEATVKLPDSPDRHFRAAARRGDLISPSGNVMRISDLPNVLEQEPNDEIAGASAAASAVPAAFNGIIEKPGDADLFRFTAKKGVPMDVNVYARTIRTPLDPTLAILDAKGRVLSSNDDSGGELDSSLRFSPPADGEYFLSVKDQLGRGGLDFVYRAEVTAVKSTLSFAIPEVSRRDTRTRQWVAVPRGGSYAIRLLAKRSGAEGDIRLWGEGLPQGVTMHAPVMKDGVSDQAVVFTAASDAPIMGKLWELSGTATSGNKKVEGHLIHTADIVRGNPNQASYYAVDLDRIAVAVIDEAPFSVKLVQPKSPIAQAGAMDLLITADRKPGYDNEIKVSLVHLPPGITALSEVTIPKGQKEVKLSVNASKAAQTGEWEIAVNAYAEAQGGGRLYISSDLAKLQVVGAFVVGKFQLANVEAGNSVKVICDLEHRNDFTGKAKVELLGLPAKANAEPVFITKDDKQAIFTVKTDPATPIGQNKSLIAKVSIEHGQEPIVQTLASNGIFRVDRNKAAGAASPAADKKPFKTSSK